MVNASEAHRGPEAHRRPEPPRAPQALGAPDADELLAALDPLSFPRRMRELAGRARAASAEGRLGALIEELERRGTYERRLAAVAAAVGGRTGHLAARLADPDPVVRHRALDTARRGGPGAVPDDALEAAFEDAPATVRRELARTVVAGRRTALADRLIEPFRERWGDGEAARLLPGCGAETVARLLPGLFHAVRGWRPLVSRHPVAVLDEAARQLAALSAPLRADWWTRYAPCVALAAPVGPERVLELLEDYGHGPLPTPVRDRLSALVAADPSRTLRLLLAPEHSGTRRRLDRAVLRRIVRADPPELAELGRALRHDADADALARVLAALPPAHRSAFYDQATYDRATHREAAYGQPAYGQAAYDGPAEGRATDGRAADGRATRGQAAHGRAADGRVEDGRVAFDGPTEGPAADGRATCGQATCGQVTYDGPADGRVSEGRVAYDGPAEGRATDGRAADGRATRGQAAHGRAADGRVEDGRVAFDGPTEGPAADGRATCGQATCGQVTYDGPADGRVSEGRVAYDGPAEGRATDGRAADGRATRGQAAHGRAADGRVEDGRVAFDGPTEGPAADGRATCGQATCGQVTYDGPADGRVAAGRGTRGQGARDRAVHGQVGHDRAVHRRESDHSVVAPAVLEVLPRARRQAEARRMADQARERGAPWTTVLESVAHLPVEEAREELAAAVRRSSAEERALAHPLLIRCVARSGDPDALTELLRQFERLRNEQDPVRSAALGALARTHPALFTDDAAEHLDRIAADAISARDSSSATRQALRRLAVALLREHAVTGRRQLLGWALRTLTRLAGSVGAADLGRLDHQLRRGQEQAVFEALRPWLEAGAERVDHELTFALARSLGRRAHALPELQELLWQAISFGSDATARTAIGLWLEPPTERDARVAELLAHEPSAAVLPPVLAVLTRRRTDLLDLVLGDTPPYGRFLTPGTHWTPPTGRDTGRWLPRQQAAAARVLARAAADTSLRARQRADAVAGAAPIPGHGAATVRTWTDTDDVVLAETALAALARTDRPGDALPALLAHAGDDRARVAMYAATRASRYVEPSRLGRLVRGMLAPDGVATAVPPVPAKVTSRKEAIRLAATLLPVADAAALLADAFELPGQHPDAQAACVAFATGLLDTKRAWELLTAAASGRRELRHAVLRTRPLDLPEAHRGRYAQLIRAVCDTEDPEVAAAGYGALARWSPWAPDAAAVLVAAVTDLGNRASWRPAADALLDLMAAAPDGSPGDNPLAWALAALATADARPGGPDAEPDRDRPAHRRIRHLADQLATRARMRPRATRRTARAAGELLAGYETFVQEAAHVLVNALDLNARPGPLAAALARLARLHTVRPALAVHTADTLRRRLNTATRPGSDAALLRAARELDEDGGHASGLFAVTLTEAAGARTAWAEPWRERLRTLRGHPHPDVRDAALRLTTAGE
ncbi:hypothetical protein [Streptomyces sp. HNM1019]|uniref:hypothetical protein n=1 Tax=Streptomyces sp. HNM1019 TaxID=3424717 RepID=UPI003D770A25